MKNFNLNKPFVEIIIALGIVLIVGVLVTAFLNSGDVTPVTADDAVSQATDAQYLVSFASDIATSPEIPAISIRVTFPNGYSIASPTVCNHDCSVDDKVTINGTDASVASITTPDSTMIKIDIGPWSLSGTIEFIIKSGITNPGFAGDTGTFTISVLNSSGGAVLDSETGISGVTITAPPNNPPTDIAFTATTFAANQAIGTTVTTMASLDADLGDTHTYALNCIGPEPLVSGADDDHFTIDGGSLKSATVFNYNTPQDADGDNVYEICVTSSDGLAIYQEVVTITVTAPVNHTPTGINFSLSPSEFEEGQAIGTTIGTLSTVDSDVVDTYTYSLTCTSPGGDEEHFTINGASVTSATVFDFSAPQDSNADNVYYFCVRTTDAGGLTYDNTLMLTITEAGVVPDSNNNPNTPTSLGPVSLVGGSDITDKTPTFNFTVTDPDISDQLQYEFYLLNAPTADASNVIADYISPLENQGQKTLTIGDIPAGGSYNIANLRNITELPLGTYYWIVVAEDSSEDRSAYGYGWNNSDPAAYSFKVVESAVRSGSQAGTNQVAAPIQLSQPTPIIINPFAPQTPFIIPKELIVINIAPNPPVDVFNNPRMPQINTAGDQVKSIQKFLNENGFPVNNPESPGGPGKETIFFGPKTRAAVMLFQRKNNLVPDGIVGPKTWAVIQKILLQKETPPIL